MADFIGRTCIATAAISVAACVFVYGFILELHVFVPVVALCLAIWSAIARLLIRGSVGAVDRAICVVTCAYLSGMSMVLLGGLGWHVLKDGAQNTNVSGYLDWSMIYALCFLPATAPALRWIVGVIPTVNSEAHRPAS